MHWHDVFGAIHERPAQCPKRIKGICFVDVHLQNGFLVRFYSGDESVLQLASGLFKISGPTVDSDYLNMIVPIVHGYIAGDVQRNSRN